MFPFLPEPTPSVDDFLINEEPEEEPEPPPPDVLKLAALQDIEECFAIFDVNKSGTMDVKYLERAFRCLGIYLTSFEMEEQQNNMNKNGVVSFTDFEDYTLGKIMESDAYDTLKESFRVFDPDDEGIIPTDRFKRWMMTLGDPLTEKEAKELSNMGDPGKKGIIAYDDLVAILTSK